MIFATAWIASPLIVFVALLGLRISGLRLGGKSRSTDKDTLDAFNRWQRAHGNAVEHVPLVLLVLFLFELAGGHRSAVLVVGVTFLASRLLHAYGTIVPSRPAKIGGAALTYGVEFALGVLLLVKMIQTL